MLSSFAPTAVHRARRATWTIAALVAHGASCRGGGDLPTTTEPAVQADPVSVQSPNAPQGATVGVPFSYDATKGGTAFRDPRGAGLTYTVALAPATAGLSASGGQITGTPNAAGPVSVTVTTTDGAGKTAAQSFLVVVFSGDLTAPALPATPLAYSDATAPLPAHFTAPGPGGPVTATDNTPPDNPVSDAGATLGRVLFYDRRLSINDRVSCASCHQQQFGFSDTLRLSRGFLGGQTGRHSMGLANARFYQRGRFFWDERAATLEAQVLQPIQDPTEMGMPLDVLVAKLSLTSFYPPLFTAAFGSPDVTADRIARALAQFVRSMVSGDATFDQVFAGGAMPPNFAGVLTSEELLGHQVFTGPRGGCSRCHTTLAQVSDNVHNTGLDAQPADPGAGQARFKSPSLRNVAVRPPYMHDGRFRTLEEVVEFYNSGVQLTPGLDPRLLTPPPNGQPVRLNLTAEEKAALVAFLRTLTDQAFLTNPKFSSPFAP